MYSCMYTYICIYVYRVNPTNRGSTVPQRVNPTPSPAWLKDYMLALHGDPSVAGAVLRCVQGGFGTALAEAVNKLAVRGSG